MAVYKRGYQRYQGPLTDRWTRFLTLPRFVWPRLMEQRMILIVLIVSLFWPLACVAFIYVSNHSELWAGLGGDLGSFLKIDGAFFRYFMDTQAVMAVILAALAGPGLIAPDLAHNALPLYFSRPLSRLDYVLARLFTLAAMLALVTLAPAALLFAMQGGLAGFGWLWDHWRLPFGVFAGFTLHILLVSLVALACSAWVKWRVVAGALVVGFFFILAGASELMNAVLDVKWGILLNPARSLYTVWSAMLGVEVGEGPGAWACTAGLVAFAAVLAKVLEKKLRPVEVIS
jgi:ABC-2 type transport system permease protein